MARVKAVGREGAGNAAAAAAWRQLAAAEAEQLPHLLAALDDAEPLAANWISAAVAAVAERRMKSDRPLPLTELEEFVFDTRHAPRARRLAYEWLARGDKTAPDRIIPQLLHDPSVEFRRDAVARLLEAVANLPEGDEAGRRRLYQQALSGARDKDQVDEIAKALGELGRPVDLAEHFGFLLRWKLIGPFDNTGKKGFPVAYPPEREIDYAAAYDGKAGRVKWIDHTTTDPYGMVDLNKALSKHMGAVGYAAAEFISDRPQQVELRLSSICAVKLWLNGRLLAEHEVYHAGTQIDQYPVRGTLKQGKNLILVKCLQNEQTETWAQDWSFQLRVCDAAGTAILSTDRPASSGQQPAE